MKLLFIIPEYPPHSGGGISTFYHNLLPELVRQGHQIRAIVGSALSPALADYQSDGVTLEFLDPQAVKGNLAKFNQYRAIPELQRHLAAAWAAWEQAKGGIDYDLIETTDWGMLFAPWIVSSASPPTVVQFHASIGQIDFYDPQLGSQLQGSFTRLLESGLLAVADELQANSQLNAQAWQELTQRAVTYIPPALRCPSIAKGKSTTNGLAVGRIQYWKGPTVLCEALRLMGQKAPTIDWLGRDTPHQNNSSMAGYLAQTYPDVWATQIRTLGTLPAEATLELQAQADFIVVPSIWDVFNYTCVEGMALAQTVLCSQGAGAADLITHGVNGLTFAANNPQALADCLETLLSMSEAARRQMGEAARHTIETQLSPARIAEQRIAAYEKLVSRGRSPIRPNPWLVDAVSPKPPLEEPLAFLNYLPLGELGQYVLQRSWKKFVP